MIGKLSAYNPPSPAMEELRKYTGTIAAKDVPVLVSAIKGRADYLITGDKKDFGKLKNKYPFIITAPSDFLDNILPEILGRLKDRIGDNFGRVIYSDNVPLRWLRNRGQTIIITH